MSSICTYIEKKTFFLALQLGGLNGVLDCLCPSQNSYAEILTPNEMILRSGALGGN